MIKKLLNSFKSSIIDSITKLIDEVITSDEERLLIKQKIKQLEHEYSLKEKSLELEFEKQITNRWNADSQSFLTRNVRPIIILTLTTAFILLAFFDGLFLTINSAYIPVFQQILTLVYTAYFGARTVEKVMINRRKNDN